jgi:hypothetical protein
VPILIRLLFPLLDWEREEREQHKQFVITPVPKIPLPLAV